MSAERASRLPTSSYNVAMLAERWGVSETFVYDEDLKLALQTALRGEEWIAELHPQERPAASDDECYAWRDRIADSRKFWSYGFTIRQRIREIQACTLRGIARFSVFIARKHPPTSRWAISHSRKRWLATMKTERMTDELVTPKMISKARADWTHAPPGTCDQFLAAHISAAIRAENAPTVEDAPTGQGMGEYARGRADERAAILMWLANLSVEREFDSDMSLIDSGIRASKHWSFNGEG